MIYQEPALTNDDRAVLTLIQAQRDHLRLYTQNAPRRWQGSLRKLTLARAVQGSNSIEGYNASLDEAVAAVEDEPPLDPRDEVHRALTGYRQALTCVLQAVRDPAFQLSEQFVKTLHFMMVQHEMTKNPGQYRPGSIRIVNDRTGLVVYEAPPRELVGPAMFSLAAYMATSSKSPFEVRAAMAHLNLTMIHPFSDGNGRMARALQTLMLAKDGGLVDPIYASIEEWLGANTEAYYAVLAETGQGSWHPERDAGPWVRFCLKAHYQQAAIVLRRNEEYAALFEKVEALRTELKLQPRMVLPIFDAALGLTLDNARYKALAEIEMHTASRDLKALVDAGLLLPSGEKRGRLYRRTERLEALRRATRTPRPLADPYVLVSQQAEVARLPGL